MRKTRSQPIVQWRALGAGSAPLTCLHPIGLDGGWFDVFTDSIGADYRLVCPDMRGHGATPDPSGAFTLRDLVDDVIDLWDSLAIEKSAVLGVSLGAMVAQGLVAAYPERVSSVVLMCTTDGFDPNARQMVENRAQRAAAPDGMAGLVDETVGRWFSNEAISADAPVVRRARSCLESQNGAVHAQYWSAMRELDFLDEPGWSSNPPPTLVVAGSDDKSFPVSVAERIAGRIGGASLHIAPGEHLFPFETPDAVSGRVLDFLRNHS